MKENELYLAESYDDTPNKYNLILKDDKILTSAFPEDIKRAIRDYGADDFKDIFGIDESNITVYKTLTGDKYYALKFHDSEDAELFFRTQTDIGLDEFLESTNSKIESRLAETFEKTIKDLQKEGLFENIKSFDLDFNKNKIDIKLNEYHPKKSNNPFDKRYPYELYDEEKDVTFTVEAIPYKDELNSDYWEDTIKLKNYHGEEPEEQVIEYLKNKIINGEEPEEWNEKIYNEACNLNAQWDDYYDYLRAEEFDRQYGK